MVFINIKAINQRLELLRAASHIATPFQGMVQSIIGINHQAFWAKYCSINLNYILKNSNNL